MSARRLPPPVPVTALRVYEPLEAFAAERRPVLAERAADPAAGRAAEEGERVASWYGLLGRDVRVALASREASKEATTAAAEAGAGQPEAELPVLVRVLRAEGAVLLSPVEVCGPAPGRNGNGSRGDDEASGRHAQVRAWEIPTAWLVLVRSEDLTRSGGPGRYVLPMSRARARAARALRALRAAVGDVDIALDVEALARWLERFHPRSWVELDTRAVAALVDGEDGAEDVRMGLECLKEGDATGLAAAYRRLSTRSHRLEQLSVSS